MDKTKVFIADDHPIFRAGLRTIIDTRPDYHIIGEAGDGVEAKEKILQLKPDIVIVDLVMPKMDGCLVTENIKKVTPETHVVILSMYKNKEYVLRAFRAGADGYVSKDNVSEDLLNSLGQVGKGNCFICASVARYLVEGYIEIYNAYEANSIDSLSMREKEVLRFIVERKTNKDIAHLLSISGATVKVHRSTIMRKFGVHNVTDLIKKAIGEGVICVKD